MMEYVYLFILLFGTILIYVGGRVLAISTKANFWQAFLAAVVSFLIFNIFFTLSIIAAVSFGNDVIWPMYIFGGLGVVLGMLATGGFVALSFKVSYKKAISASFLLLAGFFVFFSPLLIDIFSPYSVTVHGLTGMRLG